MSAVFVDTTIFLLAQGRPHPRRESCRAFLRRCEDRDVEIHASVEMLQEFVFHRLRSRPREQVIVEAKALRQSVIRHPFDDEVVESMFRLMEGSALRGRDAVHAATAVVAGFDAIVTADRDFVGVPGLTAADPYRWDV